MEQKIEEYNTESGMTLKEYNDKYFPVEELPEPEFNNNIDKFRYKRFKKAQIKEWEPESIAEKLGFVCSICIGYRNLYILVGEKHCICINKIEGAKEWWEERKLLALSSHADISSCANFECEECHRENQLWGQTEESANTCNYCGHKQKTI